MLTTYSLSSATLYDITIKGFCLIALLVADALASTHGKMPLVLHLPFCHITLGERFNYLADLIHQRNCATAVTISCLEYPHR